MKGLAAVFNGSHWQFEITVVSSFQHYAATGELTVSGQQIAFAFCWREPVFASQLPQSTTVFLCVDGRPIVPQVALDANYYYWDEGKALAVQLTLRGDECWQLILPSRSDMMESHTGQKKIRAMVEFAGEMGEIEISVRQF